MRKERYQHLLSIRCSVVDSEFLIIFERMQKKAKSTMHSGVGQ